MKKRAEMEQFQNIKTMLQIAVDIHNWENEHMKELETLSGRFILLNLVSYFCKDQSQTSNASPLKSIYRTENISEKSIRNKLKDFCANGLIEYVTLANDGRSKCAIPTNQMIQRLIVYSEQINYIIRNHFYLVDIQNTAVDTNPCISISREQAQLQKNLQNYIQKGMADKFLNPRSSLSQAERKSLLSFEV